jgi:hypothetical protein
MEEVVKELSVGCNRNQHQRGGNKGIKWALTSTVLNSFSKPSPIERVCASLT